MSCTKPRPSIDLADHSDAHLTEQIHRSDSTGLAGVVRCHGSAYQRNAHNCALDEPRGAAKRQAGMARTTKERNRDWRRRRLPPEAKYVIVYECADVADLLPVGA